jgi:hypothetical protein
MGEITGTGKSSNNNNNNNNNKKCLHDLLQTKMICSGNKKPPFRFGANQCGKAVGW